MSSSIKRSPGRFVGKVLAPLALLAMASGYVPPAFGAGGGSIEGKVDASPAKYLQDTVVYLKSVPGSYAPKTATMDQKGMKFLPRVLTVTAGDTVEFLNHDGVDHNVFSPDNEGYNLGSFKPDEKRTYTFKKENVAYSQLCSVHPEMLGYIFVGQNPYSAVVDGSGNFKIKDVPPGTYQLAAWNAKLKAPEQSVTVAAGAAATANLSLAR